MLFKIPISLQHSFPLIFRSCIWDNVIWKCFGYFESLWQNQHITHFKRIIALGDHSNSLVLKLQCVLDHLEALLKSRLLGLLSNSLSLRGSTGGLRICISNNSQVTLMLLVQDHTLRIRALIQLPLPNCLSKCCLQMCRAALGVGDWLIWWLCDLHYLQLMADCKMKQLKIKI